MIRQGRSALRTTVIPVSLVRFKVDQTKAGNGNFFGARAKTFKARNAVDAARKQFACRCLDVT